MGSWSTPWSFQFQCLSPACLSIPKKQVTFSDVSPSLGPHDLYMARSPFARFCKHVCLSETNIFTHQLAENIQYNNIKLCHFSVIPRSHLSPNNFPCPVAEGMRSTSTIVHEVSTLECFAGKKLDHRAKPLTGIRNDKKIRDYFKSCAMRETHWPF